MPQERYQHSPPSLVFPQRPHEHSRFYLDSQLHRGSSEYRTDPSEPAYPPQHHG